MKTPSKTPKLPPDEITLLISAVGACERHARRLMKKESPCARALLTVGMTLARRASELQQARGPVPPVRERLTAAMVQTLRHASR